MSSFPTPISLNPHTHRVPGARPGGRGKDRPSETGCQGTVFAEPLSSLSPGEFLVWSRMPSPHPITSGPRALTGPSVSPDNSNPLRPAGHLSCRRQYPEGLALPTPFPSCVSFCSTLTLSVTYIICHDALGFVTV